MISGTKLTLLAGEESSFLQGYQLGHACKAKGLISTFLISSQEKGLTSKLLTQLFPYSVTPILPQAMFIPAAETLDTSYFVSRYVWNPDDENVQGGSDFDDMTDSCSSCSLSNTHEEDVSTYFILIICIPLCT